MRLPRRLRRLAMTVGRDCHAMPMASLAMTSFANSKLNATASIKKQRVVKFCKKILINLFNSVSVWLHIIVNKISAAKNAVKE